MTTAPSVQSKPKRVGKWGHASLVGHPCPNCKQGEFRLRSDCTNECDHCGFELVTEYEWNRRQKETSEPMGGADAQ